MLIEPPSPPKDVKLYEIKSKSARVAWRVTSSNVQKGSSKNNNINSTPNLADGPLIIEYIIQYTHFSGNIYNSINLNVEIFDNS